MAESTRTLKLPERYHVRRRIAVGGMATVWCADDLVLGRSVAVKVLAERFAHDEMAVRRFKREARAAARVSTHSHVVTIYDVGDTEPADGDGDQTGRAFIVMEYLAGGTVADAIRLDEVNRREALRWLREAASALDHAHARGIVHRDIKPANFLLDSARVLHVADFGIARLLSEDTITSAGELFGTAAYLSPEQALGHQVTGASDRYALAVAAFELLVGERPFAAQHFAAQARQHIDAPPPSASGRNRTLPPAIDQVLMRGMAKDPDTRQPTAGELVDELETALSEGPTAVTRVAANGRRRGEATATLPLPVTPSARARAATISGPRRPPTTTNARIPAASKARPGSAARRRGGRAFAFAALIVAVLGVGIVALAAGGSPSKSSPTAKRSSVRITANVKHRARLPRPVAAVSSQTATTTNSTPTTSSTSSAPPTAEQLQSTGHQEMIAGSFQTAIPTLRQAVSTAVPGSLTYAYALYDLGRSLVLGGDPSGAIPILQQRLEIPNQTPVVRQLLDQALRATGQGPAAKPVPASPPGQAAKPVHRAPSTDSGGAGLGHAHGDNGKGKGH